MIKDYTLMILDFIVPRFITEEVAVDALGYFICPIKYIREDEFYTSVALVRSFNFFGYAMFPKVLEIREA